MLIIIQILSVLYAIIVHEFSHAYAAFKQGDDTARLDGRLTLNPLAHIDMFGTVLLPAFLIISGSPLVIGWAKPVMVNPNNFKNQRWGNTIVSLAGPAANLFSAIIFIVLIKIILFFNLVGADNYLISFLLYLIIINIILMLFNLIPIPPLDGSKFLFDILPYRYNKVKIFLTQQGPWLLLMLLILDSFSGLNFFGRAVNFLINIIYSLL